MAMQPNEAWETAGTEPRLSELLADPILHLVLRRDRITLTQVEAAVRAARERLHGPESPGPARRKSAA